MNEIYISADKDKLIRVVRAYANLDEQVWYQQQIVYITVMLLNYIKNEEDAFYALCWVMITLEWRDNFLEGLEKFG